MSVEEARTVIREARRTGITPENDDLVDIAMSVLSDFDPVFSEEG